jgi:hypothetical protein
LSRNILSRAAPVVAAHDTNRKGNVAELAIAAEAARLGLSVLKPLTEHEPFDLALGFRARLVRVQCKWASYDGASSAFGLAGHGSAAAGL